MDPTIKLAAKAALDHCEDAKEILARLRNDKHVSSEWKAHFSHAVYQLDATISDLETFLDE